MDADKIFQVRKGLIDDQIKRLEDFSYGLMRWFCTSLFVLNGGALVASIGVEEVKDDVILDIGAYFAVGIGTSMLGGFVLGLAYSIAAMHLSERAWKGDIFNIESIERDAQNRPGAAAFLVALFFMIVSAATLIVGVFEISDIVRLNDGG